MNEKRFSYLVRDLEVDSRAFADQMQRLAPAQRKYVVLFSARSGSTWLTSVLAATGALGHPEEYINPAFVASVAKSMNCREPRGLLEMLLRHRPSSNGVFGIEARHIDIELFGEQDFLAVFGGNTVYFHLWRTNIIAQGISLYRAVATEHFHSADHATPPPPPTYDARSLQGWIEHVADTENGNVTFLRRAGLAARGLCYEDIIEDREKTVLAIAKVLSVRLTQGHLDRKPDDVRIKVGDDWNLQTEARFRSENADFVNRVEAGRLVTRGLTFRPAAEAGALSAATQAGQLAAFLAGKSAGAAGDAVAGNPYTAGTHAAESWMQGWRAGWDTHPDCGFQPQPRNAGS